MPTTTKAVLRRLTLGTLLAGGIWLGLTACDGAAHADDTPAATATERPGGVLGAVADAVDQVVPTREPEPEPEVAEEPEPEAAEPEPATAPRHAADEQDEAPADEPTTEPRAPDEPVVTVELPAEVPVDIPPVVLDVPPVVVDVPPVVVTTPPVVVPPATTPAPEQTSTEQPTRTDDDHATDDTVTTPAPDVAPAPVDLPVMVGPVAGSATLLPGLAPASADDGAQSEPEPRGGGCADRDDTGVPPVSGGDGKRRRSGPDGTAGEKPRPGKPCPAPAGPDRQTNAVATVKPPPPTGEQLISDNVAGTYSQPVLHRLTQLRARGDIPAGRTEHIEPGPA